MGLWNAMGYITHDKVVLLQWLCEWQQLRHTANNRQIGQINTLASLQWLYLWQPICQIATLGLDQSSHV